MMSTITREARMQAYGITLLRVVVGAIFLAHGAQKLFQFGPEGTAGAFAQMGIPFPALSAWLVILTESLGGLALILGLGTRLAAIPLAVSMSVAVLVVHLPSGFFLPAGAEFALAMLAGSVSLGLTGPGALALDGVIRRSLGGGGVVSLLARDREELRRAA